MAIYRIRVSLPKMRFAFIRLFASSFEAFDQTIVDYPSARAVSIICIKRQAT